MIKFAPIPINKLLAGLNQDEYTLLQSIVRGGCLKASRPTVKYEYVQKGPVRIKRPEALSGRQAYLWSAVAYWLSPYKKDTASPPDARMYLTNSDEVARLDEIAKLICNMVPKTYHYGRIARGENCG